MSLMGMMGGGSPPFFTNGDFDLGDVSGWDQSDMHPEFGEVIAASQTHVHGGSWAMQMDCNSVEGPFQSHVKAAGTYTVSFWIWAAMGSFGLHINANDYTIVSADGDCVYIPSTWTKCSVEYVHSGGALKIKIADGSGGSQCWLDDFVLS